MKREGALAKNGNARWEFADYELTSGDVVEVHVGQWILGRIEYSHGSGEYVLLVGEREATLRLQSGMQARLPESRGRLAMDYRR